MTSTMKLYFSTPAWQRYTLSRICFEQRADAIEKLKSAGIEAQCIVIADDENLDIAHDFGFETFERDNQWLGQRFNDGYEWAATHGGTYVLPIGSDSWIDPQFIIDAFNQGEHMKNCNVIASRHYTRINQHGTLRKQLYVPVLQGVHYAVPISMMADCGYRPCVDEIKRGCDGSAWQTLAKVPGADITFIENHLLESVAFESYPQITSFDKLGVKWGAGETTDCFSDLYQHYPYSVVDQIIDFYQERRSLAAVERESALVLEQRQTEIVYEVLDEHKVPSAFREQAKLLIRAGIAKAWARA